MLLRSKADPSIIACVSRRGTTGMKLTRAKVPYPGEAPAGTLFKYAPHLWDETRDREAQMAYLAYMRTPGRATMMPPAVD